MPESVEKLFLLQGRYRRTQTCSEVCNLQKRSNLWIKIFQVISATISAIDILFA